MKYPNELKDITLQEMNTSFDDSVEFEFWSSSVDVRPHMRDSTIVQLDYDSVKKLHKKLGKWIKRYEFYNEVD
ncbi:hypothetical protein FOL75_12170 [Bacillus thuringiensis]|uniref:hypothetical protein n=1 Tax=Bacillus thuringiensis TaxID=1428 RepID=UPI0028538C2A|nr:hypothetical protein [Bacillus thuringiensis]MDR5022700.1 hypothetical protein [Bacillus thuringiensis]